MGAIDREGCCPDRNVDVIARLTGSGIECRNSASHYNIMEKALTESQIREELTRLKGWEYKDHRIVKTFHFKHFAEAMSFLVRLSYECERRDHHPEIYNLYNQVTIGLNTHSAGDRVTPLDIILAKDVDHFAWRD